jgi:hypothetical protein
VAVLDVPAQDDLRGGLAEAGRHPADDRAVEDRTLCEQW